MIDGQREKAERIFFESLSYIKAREKKNNLIIFLEALENGKPYIQLRTVRRGGANYQIPVPLKKTRAISLSMKWVIEAARKKKGSFSYNLSQSLIEASKNQGESVQKRQNLHLLALKNRSLTHFR